MADISDIINKTSSAIDDWYESQARSSFAKYLSISELGHPCSRYLWYIFRNFLPKEKAPGRVQRIFQTGQEQEKRVLTALQGIALVGNCQSRVNACNGHLAGAIDAEAIGLPESTESVHIVEIKSHNNKNFNLLAKDGLPFKHLVQTMVYGYLRKRKRFLYLAVNKDNEELWQERGPVDEDLAQAQIDRAERIIKSNSPPAKISDKPESWECRWCPAKAICHQGAPFHHSVRNDGTHIPGENGEWIEI